MILTILKVNGNVYFSENKTKEEAEMVVAKWLAEAKKNYPYGNFVPTYYQAEVL